MLAGFDKFNEILETAVNVGFETCATDCKAETQRLLFAEVARLKESGRKERVCELLLKQGANPNIKQASGQTALTVAASYGFDQVCQLLLNNNATVDVQDETGATPLMFVANINRTEIDDETAAALGKTVEVLLKSGASLDITNKENKTVLEVAAQAGNDDFAGIVESFAINEKFIEAVRADDNVETARLLEDEEVNVDVQDREGRTPLIIAALKGNVKIVKILLEHNATINIQDYEGNTALMLAGFEDFYKLTNRAATEGFFRCRSNCKAEFRRLMFKEVENMKAAGVRMELVLLLLSVGADPNIQENTGQTPLTYAASFGFDEIAKVLIDNGAIVDIQDESGATPLMFSASIDREGVTQESWDALGRTVNILLENGASLDIENKKGQTANVVAKQVGNRRFIRIVQYYVANVKLFDAVRGGDVEEVSKLVTGEVNIDFQDKQGQSPLIHACLKGNTALVKVLLANNASVDLQDVNGNTALMLAGFDEFNVALKEASENAFGDCKKNCKAQLRAMLFSRVGEMKKSGIRLEIAELLLDHKASPDIQDKSGQTALSFAASFGFSKIVELLLKHDATIDIQDVSGATPLMFAASIDSEGIDEDSWTALGETIEILLKNGASIDIKNKKGKTALMIADQVGNDRFAKIIEDINVSAMWIMAVKVNNIEKVTNMIEDGIEIDVKDKEGRTGLMHAVLNGNLEMTLLLLNNNAAIDLQDNYGQTAFMLSGLRNFNQLLADADDDGLRCFLAFCKPGIRSTLLAEIKNIKLAGKREELLNLLLENGANVNIQDESGMTALIQNAIFGFERIVSILIENGANIDVQDETGSTALMYAANIDREGIDTESWDALGRTVQILLQSGASLELKNNDGKTTLQLVGQTNDESGGLDRNSLDFDLSTIDVQDEAGRTPLINACLNENTRLVEILLESKANPDIQDNDGYTALMLAGMKEFNNVLERAISRGKSSTQIRSILFAEVLKIKASGKRLELVKILLQFGANADLQDFNGQTALTLAASFGFDIISELLLQSGASIDLQDKSGSTPLMFAASIDSEGVDPESWAALGRTVEILLKNKASLDITNDKGQTALNVAEQVGNSRFVEVIQIYTTNVKLFDSVKSENVDGLVDILEDGANIDAKDQTGFTALHHAAYEGNLELVKLILSYNASLDIQDLKGQTPLIVAATFGFDEIVDILLKNKASVDIQDSNGNTALMFAAGIQKGTVDETFWEGLGRTIKILLKNGASLSIKNIKGENADMIAANVENDRFAKLVENNEENIRMFSAIESENIEAISSLLADGVSIDITDDKGQTPLIHAALKGSVPLVEFLLENNADVDIQDNNGYTSLLLAGFENLAVAENEAHVDGFFGGCIPNCNQDLRNIFFSQPQQAKKSKSREELVEILLTNEADPNIQENSGRTALTYAALFGFDDIAEILINYNATVDIKDANGNTPLMNAAALDIVDLNENSLAAFGRTIQILLHNGASLDIQNAMGKDAKALAKLAGNSKFLDVVENYAGQDKLENIKLLEAVTSGKAEEVELYLSSGANIDIQNRDGITPLIQAAMSGKLAVVFMLLENKADPNVQDNNGNTALMMAGLSDFNEATKDLPLLVTDACGAECRGQWFEQARLVKQSEGHLELIRLLLTFGANPNIQNKEGNTPLHSATLFRNKQILETLLNSNAIVDAQNQDGDTALMLATKINREGVDDEAWNDLTSNLDTLLSYGASLVIENNAGETAITLDETVGGNRLGEIVESLDLNSFLNNAVQSGNTEWLKTLLNDEANIALIDVPNDNIQGSPTLLSLAAAKGDIKAVQILLAYGANVNGKNGGGDAAIGNAGLKDYNSALESYRRQVCGEDLLACDFTQFKFKEALKLRKSEAMEAILRILLQNGADPDVRHDSTGQSMLHFAASLGLDNIVTLLLDANASVDLKNSNNGDTALMLAARYAVEGIDAITQEAFARTVEILLKNGASITVENNAGETAIDIAEAIGNTEFVKISKDFVESAIFIGGDQLARAGGELPRLLSEQIDNSGLEGGIENGVDVVGSGLAGVVDAGVDAVETGVEAAESGLTGLVRAGANVVDNALKVGF